MNAPESSAPARMDRRAAIKWMLTAAASATLLARPIFAADAAVLAATGYGTDPDLLKDYKPGDLWPLTLTEAQRRTSAALCDVIIPADAKSPAASSLGVHDFIDEWISAPYPGHAGDRRVILEGLAWLEAESRRRFESDFANLVSRARFVSGSFILAHFQSRREALWIYFTSIELSRQ